MELSRGSLGDGVWGILADALLYMQQWFPEA